MAEEKGSGVELATGLQSIFNRVGEFFHIFDLSFFVGGASTFSALAFLYIKMGQPLTFPFAQWVGVLALVIACYVCGLIAFAVGRAISGGWFRREVLASTLPRALSAHGLSNEESITEYTSGPSPRYWWLYIRMWSEIVHVRSTPAVVHHLMHYWATAATYDAVAFSFLVWAIVLVAVELPVVVPRPIGIGLGITGAVVFVAAAFFAFRRGADYYKYQVEDVVAHFAVTRRPLIVSVETRATVR